MTTALRPIRETDDLYAELLAAHSGLSPEESARLNARLVLILMSRQVDNAAFRLALADARVAEDPRGASSRDR